MSRHFAGLFLACFRNRYSPQQRPHVPDIPVAKDGTYIQKPMMNAQTFADTVIQSWGMFLTIVASANFCVSCAQLASGILNHRNMSKEPLNQYLRMYRSRHCLSQEEMAYLVGAASSATLARWESGARTLSSLEAILALEIVFGIPAREIFAGRFLKVEREVGQRAADLVKRIRATGLSPANTAKLQLLTKLARHGATDT